MIYELVAHTAETIVFLFLGIGLFTFNHPFEMMGWGLFLTTILNLNIARFLNISIVTVVVNKTRTEKTKISRKIQFVMWFAGLRGAMAYALALQASETLAIGPVILAVTLLYALLNILVFGSMMHPLLTKLDVKNKPDLDSDEAPRSNCCNKFKQKLASFDENYFAPFFVKDFKNV
jgi:sodium/hydrogen exchanger 8